MGANEEGSHETQERKRVELKNFDHRDTEGTEGVASKP